MKIYYTLLSSLPRMVWAFRSLLSLLLCLTYGQASAQAPTPDIGIALSGVNFNPAVNDIGRSVARDAAGNVYVTGSFQGIADFDPSAGTANLVSAGNTDIFVAKYNSSGAYQWAFAIGGTSADTGFGIAIDASGNVYVTGSFQGIADFDPSVGTANLSSAGSEDIFVAKYNSSGAYQWAFRIGGANNDRGLGIAIDASGNVLLTGYLSGTTIDFDPSAGTADLSSAGSEDIFVAKYNSSGAYQWAFRIGGANNDRGLGIATDASGNVLLTGQFVDTNIDFDPDPVDTADLSSAGNFDIFVAKYTSIGAYQWAFRIGGASGDIGNGIATDASGNVLITGQFLNTNIDFDPDPVGTANLSSAGSDDIFVAKYNSSGAYQWAFPIGGTGFDIGYGIATDASDNVLLTGYFQGTVDFDPSAGTANLTSAGSIDVFVAKYTSSGAYQWAFRIGGANNDIGYGIATDASGNVLLTGQFQNANIDFNPDPVGTANLTSLASSVDIFVAKYNSSNAYQWAGSVGGNVPGADEIRGTAVDASGNIYVTGSFQGTVDFDPSAGTANLTSAGNQDIFVAKYNSSGAYQWAFRIGGTGFDTGYGIATDASGNVLLTGQFVNANIDFDPSAGTANLSTAGGLDIFVAKYNSSGAYQWAFRIGGTVNDIGYGIATDASGNVLLTGQFAGTNIDFDPSAGTANLTSAGLEDIFVAKYNSSGAYQWAFRVGGTGSDIGYGIATDASDNVLLTGRFLGTNIDFDPSASAANLSSAGGSDIFVAKYNSSGAYQWAFRIGGGSTEVGYGIATDASGNVLLTGQFIGSIIDFDPDPVGTANLSSAGSEDIFVAKYNSSGAYQWAFRIGGTGNDIGFGIATDALGNVLLTGQFQGTDVDFDPNAGTANFTSAGGSFDIFVAKYNSSGAYQWAFGIGGTANDIGYAIKVDASNQVYLGGRFIASTINVHPSGTFNVLANDPATTQGLLVRYQQIPEINLQGNATTIADGDATPDVADHTQFGNVSVGSNLARTYTIQNTGAGTLTISSITSSDAKFVVSGAPTNVAAGSSATFTVTYTPTIAGADNATITINNDDVDEAIYDFAVQGTGVVASNLQYRTAGAVTFASPTNWESSPDGTTWTDAAAPPDGTANTLTITIRNGHTATVGANISLDEITVQSGGTLQVNTGVTLTILDGTGTDFIVESIGIVTGAGNFTLSSSATLQTAQTNGLSGINVSGTKTFADGANYVFNGTALQTINNSTDIIANNFTIDNNAGATLSNHLSITGSLSIVSGDLNLNGKNITLTGTATFSEDRSNDHILTDATAIDDANLGGYIEVPAPASVANISTANEVFTAGEVNGTGLYLGLLSGGSLTGLSAVRRYHYRGAGKSNPQVYVATATTATNVILGIEYPSQGMIPATVDKIYRYSTDWQALDATLVGNRIYTNAAIPGFSSYTTGSSLTGLPVSLAGFDAARLGTTAEVRLTWATASEQNNKGFEVEASADGQVFKQIGFVEGAGNSLSRREYRYATTNADAAYYRLRQVDVNGAFTYSPVRYVESAAATWQIFPNPSDGKMTLRVGDGSNPAVSITNTLGVEVWRGKAGDIDLRGAAAGVYYVHFTHTNKPRVARIVIK